MKLFTFIINDLNIKLKRFLNLSKFEIKSKNEYPRKDIINYIVEILYEVLGVSVTEALFFHIYSKKGLEKHQIQEKFDIFIEGLRDIFGEASNVLIEIIKERVSRIYNKELKTEKELVNFIKYGLK